MAVTIKKVLTVRDKIEDVKMELEDLMEQKQYVLDNANDAEYPNEERIETLQDQINIFEEAVSTMDDTINTLESYE